MGLQQKNLQVNFMVITTASLFASLFSFPLLTCNGVNLHYSAICWVHNSNVCIYDNSCFMLSKYIKIVSKEKNTNSSGNWNQCCGMGPLPNHASKCHCRAHPLTMHYSRCYNTSQTSRSLPPALICLNLPFDPNNT